MGIYSHYLIGNLSRSFHRSGENLVLGSIDATVFTMRSAPMEGRLELKGGNLAYLASNGALAATKVEAVNPLGNTIIAGPGAPLKVDDEYENDEE